MWSPRRFALFQTERLRPARDLLTRVSWKLPGTIPSILDVGCGHGESSKLLLHEFPNAKLLCMDIDADRLKEAQEDEGLSSRALCSFKCESVEDHFSAAAASSGAVYDLIFSNAAMHWTDVAELLPRMLRRVRPGGALAL